ncbi:MAG: glycosyltransferase [Acidobacteriota bacterium]
MIAPPEARRVLIATIGLMGRGGTDVYTRDLALALLRRGWLPIIYTTIAGPFAEELRAATVPIVNSIDAVGAPPDVIHGHHHVETLVAMARFPGVPALFVSHDAITWHSVPPRSPRIGAYVAVDRNCRDRMIFEHGIAEQRIRVMGNAVDLRRFTPRPPLPTRPARALAFSNAVTANNWGATLRSACRQRGITLDLAGSAADSFVDRPEELLPRYDLVFGKARCALEAMASGAAVIVCDERGLSGMVTSGDLPAARQLNFGARTLQRPITVENILREIDRYDPADAARVSAHIRASADVDLLAGEFIELYEELIAAKLSLPPEDELRAMAASLERLLPLLHGRPTPPGRLRWRLANSRMLAYPARLLHQLKRRLGV